jgi:glycosyltransferase involved in cell wall biosynthesis
MRIAIVNSHLERVGGVESYLTRLLPALLERGHELSYLSEVAPSLGRDLIVLPAGTERWCLAEGPDGALDAFRRWRPQLIFAHGLRSPAFETALLDIAPGVFYAHGYYGACISGSKTLAFPSIRPCTRRFGPACIACYFPRRCGGLSPLTMVRQYEQQTARLRLLSRYCAVLVASEHMRREFAQYGIAAPVRVVPLPTTVEPWNPAGRLPAQRMTAWHLLYLGRLDRLKGPHLLIDAAATLAERLDRRIVLTIAGDGPERRSLVRRAAAVTCDRVEIRLPGWLGPDERRSVLQTAHVLLLPSLWPEPFGLAGLEAGLFGVPAVAFDVGGVSEWLSDGVNGALVDRSRGTEGLVEGMARCLSNEADLERLSQAARTQAGRFGMDVHLTALEGLFNGCIHRSEDTGHDGVYSASGDS